MHSVIGSQDPRCTTTTHSSRTAQLHVGNGGDNPAPYAFAFNDKNFSDRLLHIELIPECEDFICQDVQPSNPVSSTGSKSYSKRRRTSSQDADNSCVVQQHADAEELQTGGRVVKSVHICSAILAGQSPFFYKLFTSNFKEAEQRDATLRIRASEESALMDMLEFTFTGKVKAQSSQDLLDVLLMADRFQVDACTHHCTKLLNEFDLTVEDRLQFLNLPVAVQETDAVKSLIEGAKEHIAVHFRDLHKMMNEALTLPLPGVEILLESDAINVSSEDIVFDFVIKWVRQHTQDPVERQEVFKRLIHLVRFPWMSNKRLMRVCSSPDLDQDYIKKMVIEALLFKAESPFGRQKMAKEAEEKHKRFRERSYKLRPVKAVAFDNPWPHCIVYLDLKIEEVRNLWPKGHIYSQSFHCGEHEFFMSAQCNANKDSNLNTFGLFLGMHERGASAATVVVDYDFSVRTVPSMQFVSRVNSTYTFTSGKVVGYRDLFLLKWENFVADNSPFFFGGVLYIRVELSLKQNGNRPPGT
ncbi:hypothetical protein CBR_g54193 [Chara braunii]|uniref:BTB domain-containing protein n=1 Tax=Chara braunii TaxID=69332 RepID=A0A388K774_CHABU|nr:hypothetical protein CBR_g54193 [Chara braunii]|eukprot:GBG65902.1 hypothetical protein CBR_g54193 [Chara braunii]